MNFETYYNESILDLTRSGLDPAVFQLNDGEPPVLNAGIKAQIVEDVLNLRRSIGINKIYIIGSILTRNYTRRSDIDVTIEVNKEDLDPDTGIMGVEKVIQLLTALNGKLAVGTTHPINYYITTDFDEDNADAIYDMETDKWLKEPLNSEIRVADYLRTFNDLVSNVDLITGKLRRDAIDFNELQEFDDYSVVNMHSILTKKMYEINKSIDSLVRFKDDLKSKRKEAFSHPLSPEEIVKYSSKNKLPANVVYKLFQRYYYFDLISKLDEIINNRDQKGDYVKDIENLLDYKESLSFEQFVKLEEGVRKFKSRSVNWKDPKSIRTYRDRRFAATRKAGPSGLKQIPDSQRSHRVLGLSQKIVDVAKRAPSGIWRLTPLQVRELAIKYHHISPNARNPVKHLGNTGIVVWRKAPQKYYLVKHRAMG